ncbi:glycine--tRNA ligase subunit beta [Legionella dresdenensis]|uniref:Glycine--tRNA ligase beta subunit n=1 Tax=Legionella dresdenensis TaxID=450200 RepID=A0ABV8CIG2_9GAMM
MVNDFLFELGCEELPSGAVRPLADALTVNLTNALAKAQINYTEVKSFATPRRLTVLIKGLQTEQPSQRQLRRGPAKNAAYDADGNPTQALQGFARSCGVALDELTVVSTDKGEWLVYEAETSGAKTHDLLPDLLREAIRNLPIAKPMRWGDGDAEFARPVHWVVMLFGSEVIATEILGVKTDRLTYGHRFHAPQAIELANPDQYENSLYEAFVVADFDKRKQQIIKQINETAAKHEAEAVMPDDLLEEVTSIVEWPEALAAHFDSEFLDVPAEALIAAMQSHQKCFALQRSGKLLPVFITIANIRSANPEQVIAGNEKVMRARLSDAAFFFRQDKKAPLASQIKATGNVVFQVKLGTLLDKSNRIQRLMSILADKLNLDKQQAARAAELSKCDLMTGMVGEFPELQGLMGYYYANHDGEAKPVAIALNEQYLPRFAGDSLPETDLGLALSLADRLDTLAGIFAIGQKPSGVKDPFKLRRHALAVVRLLIGCKVELDLSQLIIAAVEGYGSGFSAATVLSDLHPFIMERLLSYYQAQDVSQDFVQAVKARQPDWLYDFDNRLKALVHFVALPEAGALSAACKRVNNLLQNNKAGQQAVREDLLTEQAEKDLFAKLAATEEAIKPLYNSGNYTAILTELASLRNAVDAFFDNVMVMVDNEAIKNNRLALLLRLKEALQGVADISVLQLNP